MHDWVAQIFLNKLLPLPWNEASYLRLSTFDSRVSPWRSTEKVVSMVSTRSYPAHLSEGDFLAMPPSY
jgi:hypothetical protein